MADIKKQISEAKHLQARGLFTLAATHYAKAREAELAMIELLGCADPEYAGHLSDEACNGGDFDKGMKKEGFTIIPPKKTRR